MDEYPTPLDHTFAALAHPTRRRILELLDDGEWRVTDLAGQFTCSLNVVSVHVRSLERAGLVQRQREGRVHRLRLNPVPLVEAASFVERYRARWERQLDHLGHYLNRMATNEARKKDKRPG